MDNCHDTRLSPAAPEIARSRFHQKTIFDGTKLSLEPSNPKTTTYGIKCPFRLFSTTQNITTFSPPPRRANPPLPRERACPELCRRVVARSRATGEGGPHTSKLTF